MARDFDLREAINAVSDVVVNRPSPLREFDQIYMKVADMVIQAHYVANRYDSKDVVFIGDGDAIGLAVMHLGNMGIFNTYPSSVTLLDFDERIVSSVNRFAEKYDFKDKISAHLYNVVEPLPPNMQNTFDAFHTNPPWGASNGGESVHLFLERGIEACKDKSEGVIVIADDKTLEWTQQVLKSSQSRASELGYLVAELLPEVHSYHLDDSPDLKSCTCLFRCSETVPAASVSNEATDTRLKNFYGRDNPLRVKYVREVATLNYGKATDQSYSLESFGSKA